MGPFGQLFWGYVLFFFSFEIVGIDVLEVLGYLYIAHVLRRLKPRGAPFRKARIMAFWLAGLPLLGRLVFAIPGVESNALPFAVAYVVLDYSLHIVMTLIIIEGLRALAVAQDKKDLARRARYTKVAYPFFCAVTAVLSVVIITRPTPEAMVEWLIPLILASVIAGLMVLLLFRKADRTLLFKALRPVRRFGSRRAGRSPGRRAAGDVRDGGEGRGGACADGGAVKPAFSAASKRTC
jgi:hypothetical protein